MYAPQAAMTAPAPNGGGMGIGLILALGIAVVLSCGAGLYFQVGVGTTTPAPSLADQLAAMQQQQQALADTQTTGPTPPPLCPEDYDPVVDINGKVYKNSCYALSVGAQFAPQRLNSAAPTAAAGPTIKPALAALLARMPSASGTNSALNRSAPAIVQRGPRQVLQGGRVVQGPGQRRAVPAVPASARPAT